VEGEILTRTGVMFRLHRSTRQPERWAPQNLRYDKTSGMRMFPHVVPIPSREREEQTPRDLQFRVHRVAIIGPECRCVFADQELQRCKELR